MSGRKEEFEPKFLLTTALSIDDIIGWLFLLHYAYVNQN